MSGLDTLIPKTPSDVSQGSVGLERSKYLLSLLGNPQEKIKVIHLAGTSGKGSTSYFISSLLVAHGFKVGLHFKPHVFDIRERFQINNTLLSEEKTVAYANAVFDAVKKVARTQFGSPTYFETLVALAYYVFYKEHVDYGVIETGLGGLYDGTNVVENPSKIAVITRLGIDHTAVLGNTKEEIAYQKAKIIHDRNIVISIFQEPSQRKVIEKVATQAHTSVIYVKKNLHYKIPDPTHSICFSYSYEDLHLNPVYLNAPGAFQVENAALALTTVKVLSRRDGFQLSEKMIINTLKNVQIAGRYQHLLYKNASIILDGAHNVQKMKAFLSGLLNDYPNQKFVFLVAFKKGKNSESMMKEISKYAKEIVITTFEPSKQDMYDFAQSPDDIITQIKRVDTVPLTIKSDPHLALQYALTKKAMVVITGSLYLVSQVLPSLL